MQRSKLIKDKLEAAGFGFLQQLAVVVSPLSREEVKANLEDAGKHEIAVICREEIEQLLSRVFLVPNAEQLFEEAKRLIPSVGQQSLFGGNT